MLYGRTTYNPVSRFVSEIPDRLLERDLPPRKSDFGNPRGSQYGSYGQPKTYISGGVATGTGKPKTGVGDSVTIGKTLFKQPTGGVKETFKESDRVSHMTFGDGEIISVRPMGADILYEIIFDKVGTKKLMATYARLKKI